MQNLYSVRTGYLTFNPLKTKRWLLYLKTQSVPRSLSSYQEPWKGTTDKEGPLAMGLALLNWKEAIIHLKASGNYIYQTL
jgi:hypothetical protein